MDNVPTSPIHEVSQIIRGKFASDDALSVSFGSLVRRSLDEVIDTLRTGRTSLSELEKTEKTYIGTKVEILTRSLLSVKKGNKLDLKVGDHEVDVKFTVGNTWMIPMEAFNEVCLLIVATEKKNSFGVGLLQMNPENLTSGENRDKKKSVSANGKKNILWLAQGKMNGNHNEIEYII